MAARCLDCLHGSLLLLLAAAVLMLHSLVLQVSAVTCYEGVGQIQVSNNSTIKLRVGELLILHCIANRSEYRDLERSTCEELQDLPAKRKEDQFTLNITWFCHITRNTSWTMEIFGFTNGTARHVNLYELDIEVYDIEQCLADARTTPSPCTTPPPPMTEPASTSPTTSTTETTTEAPTTTTEAPTTITTNFETTDPIDTTDPFASTDPTNIISPDKIQINNTIGIESEEIKENTLYGVLCVLGVVVIVQFWVIVLLAVKLCYGKQREKVVEEGETVSDQQQELRRINQLSSDRDNDTVISNRSSTDVETTADSSIPKTEI